MPHRLATSILAAAALVLGAYADDWTVSANTTLSANKTVDALTVESGATLDLNGYSLTCSSIAGAGNVYSTLHDLTSPDPDGAHVTWSTSKGEGVGSYEDETTAQNLFNATTPSIDDANQMLVPSKNLPLAVTYDFGEGADKIVNKYRIYCYRADSDKYKSRCPRDWTFEGSNDNNSWTLLDSRSAVAWKQGSSPKEFSFSNDTAYRYYRLTITASSASDYLELNQLEYFHKGELRMNVPEGVRVDVPSVAGTDDVTFFTEVNGGTVNLVRDFDVCYTRYSEGVMIVNSGSVLRPSGYSSLFVGRSGEGTLTINGGVVDVYRAQVGEHVSKSVSGTINLNGGTLKTSNIYTVSKSTGNLFFYGGTLEANAVDINGLISDTTTVTVKDGGGTIKDGGGTIDSGAYDINIGAAILGTGAMRFQGGGSITLSGASDYSGGTTIELGTKIITNQATTKNTILRNLVIDGAGRTPDASGIPVFQFSDVLEPADIASVRLVNCAPGSVLGIDANNPTTLRLYKRPGTMLTFR